jgi:hypothetical protein
VPAQVAGWQAGDVLTALVLDLNQGGALGLGLDHCRRLAIHEQQVVNPPVTLLKDELADRHAPPHREVGLVGVLDEPAGVHKQPVDLDPRLCLAREVGVVEVSHGP